ncbi:MAG: membrane dipeptidase [Oscillospiraceae bacterium]|nr:membrane dipeptidase [Oscillospiraceae bacterium]
MSIPYFDAHCDTISRKNLVSLRRYEGQLDLERLGAFARAGQIFAIFANSAKLPQEQWFAECARQREIFVREMAANAALVTHCRTAAEAEAAFAAGKVAAFLSIEGAELLCCDPALLQTAESWGVRAVNLTWNNPNAISGTNCRESERGLSEVGRAFVKEAEKRNIRIDVSHLSDRGFWDLMEIAEKPVIASHSNCRALCGHSRNLTDEQIRALRKNGGFAGVNVYSDFVGEKGSMEELVAHVEHFWEIGGEEIVGLGGDWDGCDSLAGGLTGVQDLPRLYEALLRRNHSEKLLEKLFVGNLLRVLG